MSKRLTAAQIGCGKFATSNDFPNLTQHPDVDLKWACDINLDNARRVAGEFGVPQVTSDFMDIVKDPQVDFIKIATTHEVHLPIIEAAAAAGKHIFCEKPMAMVDTEAYRIIRAVRKAGIKLCVDFNRRMSPALQALRAKWKAHAANPQHNPWQYIEVKRAPLAEENLAHLNIRIQDESASYGVGHLDPLHGGGLIIGETVHWLDLACWFFDPLLPERITAWGSSRLSHGLNLRFQGGANMTLDFSCSGTFDFPKELYEVTHNAALFRSLAFVENNYYGMPDNGTEYFPLQADGHPELGEGFAAYMAKYQRRTKEVTDLKSAEDAVPFKPDKGHRAMLDAFVKAIQNDTPSPCDELAGFRATYLAQRCIQAMELGQTLPIPLEKITPVFC